MNLSIGEGVAPDDDDPWVPIKLAADYAGRPWRTLQTWAHRGHIPRRLIAGALHVPLYATMRVARERHIPEERA